MERTVGFKTLPQAIDDAVYVSQRWPLVIDPEGKAATYLRYNSRIVNAMFADEVTPENLRKALVNTLKSGTWLTFNFDVFEGDLSSFFSPSFPETVLSTREVMKPEFLGSLAQPEELKVGKDNLVPRAGFKLIIVSKRQEQTEWMKEHFILLKIDHAVVESERKEHVEFKSAKLPEEERVRK